MALPNDAPSMPWALRSRWALPGGSDSSQDIASSEVSFSVLSNLDRSPDSRLNILTRQLAESFTAQHELRQQVAALTQELTQCRKRENAIQAVFAQNHEDEQRLAREKRSLEQRESVVKAEEERIQAEWQKLGEQETTNDELFESHSDFERYTDDTVQFDTTSQPRRSECSPMSTIFAYGGTEDLFDLRKWAMVEVNMSDTIIKLLRRHDYYGGWLDCMRMVDHDLAHKNGELKYEEVRALWDFKDMRNPYNAGYNAGAAFAWSAICRARQVPHKDVRLDDKVWLFRDLAPISSVDKSWPEWSFWTGVKDGRKEINKEFKRRQKTGDWGPAETILNED